MFIHRRLQSLQEKEEYGAPKVMQATMKELFPAKRDSIRVLDVGAGTGLCGLVLQEAGFTNVDALDPAQEMLKAAQDKGVYRNILNVFLTGQPIDVPADTYDAIVLVGVIHHGSLPCEAFEEMVRLVKPGGYIVNCMRAAFLTEIPQYAEKWEPLVARLEREGKWKVVKMDRYPNHFLGNEGMRMVFHVC
ncbi:hypothetical protein BaRGS_00040206 [Batillaria attramentaria]|uniref:Methyltransferase type 11 domain-containing protein n=1 Tax=Batillaria attramentaria TaxID=370345 RepID=A0ABD0J127_9CAEN